MNEDAEKMSPVDVARMLDVSPARSNPHDTTLTEERAAGSLINMASHLAFLAESD